MGPGAYQAPTLDERIQVLKNLSSRNNSELASQKIPEDKVPVAYIAILATSTQAIKGEFDHPSCGWMPLFR